MKSSRTTSNLPLVVAGLLIGILVSAMDNTIVATAMGSIVGDLGGLDKFVWVTSAYMVAEMAGMPIFGKLSDMYGRKRFFIFGLLVFLLGSILCGTAQNIVQLSIYRAIQGIGGGALVPIAFAIMFDVIPPQKRGAMGGLFGAVFGLSSIFGPLLGAYVTDYIDWRWVFYINLPLGLIAFVFVAFFYKESIRHAKQRIDWAGAVTLVAAIICLMFALELGGQKYDWNSPVIISLFALFTVLFVSFLLIERKAAEPIISYAMFKVRLYASSSLIGIFSGAAFIVATVYIPIYIQGVQGGTATNSGLLLLPMMLGSVVASQVGAQFAMRTSYRNVMFVSGLILITGIALLTTLTADSSRLAVTLFMIVVGLGIGASFSVLGMASIHHFDETKRGSANSTLAFLRSLGMTIGITLFGMIQRNSFMDSLGSLFGSTGGGSSPAALPSAELLKDPRALLSPEARAGIPDNILRSITDALSSSIAQTFLWTLIPAVLSLLFVFLMSNEKVLMHGKTGQPVKPTPEV
ncbi:MDR family MFS transporter [Paenibacillus ginsengarvi]|uniref:DHA2 family efflux MFS transporter permease subunit n=1 Tax=Paenibacillus ginsengarvi TaxID=400777 RepID=A0A3B0CHX1_9BACL|nr:MDR family MFS transporter [Paenibacillus ginsengarvi]RKN84802.1 DHA2 family efflux MFS transporter permease subunit [Paenibacillus ginsengarvi]